MLPGFDTGVRLGPCIADLDAGIYARSDTRSGLLIVRGARRFPDLTEPSQPRGIAGVYDVASDWTPIYDKTDRDGFYVAIGTSGNQFKNAPLAGEFLAQIITAVDAGHDHDPVQYTGTRQGSPSSSGRFPASAR
ncbi:FAD-dependent oxidoreductase [Rhodococcus marinonascens]|uniref:FAD-dependent oxidoreductase n=1 Tax=Rhodococcus marinonascens TaxID=38311 RepID=UPI00093259E4|nr:FAD-dependent oxidoreductase [Rhodococcus marinonascens]